MTDRIDPTSNPLVVSAKDLAALLGASERHIRRMDAGGQLPAPLSLGRLRRWSLQEIRDWLAAGCPCRHDWMATKPALGGFPQSRTRRG